MSEADWADKIAEETLKPMLVAIDEERSNCRNAAAKWKAEGYMYGWNFYEGKASGTTEFDFQARRFLLPVLAQALREARLNALDEALSIVVPNSEMTRSYIRKLIEAEKK